MTAAKVIELRDATPFQPFEIRLADGRGLRVAHPDFVSISEDAESIDVHDAETGNLEIIDLLLVVSLRHRAAD